MFTTGLASILVWPVPLRRQAGVVPNNAPRLHHVAGGGMPHASQAGGTAMADQQGYFIEDLTVGMAEEVSNAVTDAMIEQFAGVSETTIQFISMKTTPPTPCSKAGSPTACWGRALFPP